MNEGRRDNARGNTLFCTVGDARKQVWLLLITYIVPAIFQYRLYYTDRLM